MLKLLKCQKNNFKKLEDSKPRIIETMEKNIWLQSLHTKEKYKRKVLLKYARRFHIMQKINPKIQMKLKN